jgi:Mg2+ and Co2+ transporter CorA
MRLLSKSNDEIVEMLDKMDKEVKAFEKELVQLAWSSRSATLNEVYATSPTQRQHLAELFKDNLELSQKSGLSFF